VDERKLEIVLLLQALGGGQLSRRAVESDATGSAAGKPCRYVSRSTPILEHVLALHIGEQAGLGLADAEDAPFRFALSGSLAIFGILVGDRVPGVSIADDVVAHRRAFVRGHGFMNGSSTSPQGAHSYSRRSAASLSRARFVPAYVMNLR